MTERQTLPRDLLARLAELPGEELPGWWDTVCVAKLRAELPGERAMILERARALGVRL